MNHHFIEKKSKVYLLSYIKFIDIFNGKKFQEIIFKENFFHRFNFLNYPKVSQIFQQLTLKTY